MHEGGAGDLEDQGRSKYLCEATGGAEGLKGASGDRAKELEEGEGGWAGTSVTKERR